MQTSMFPTTVPKMTIIKTIARSIETVVEYLWCLMWTLVTVKLSSRRVQLPVVFRVELLVSAFTYALSFGSTEANAKCDCSTKDTSMRRHEGKATKLGSGQWEL